MALYWKWIWGILQRKSGRSRGVFGLSARVLDDFETMGFVFMCLFWNIFWCNFKHLYFLISSTFAWFMQSSSAYRIRSPRDYIFQKGFLGEFQFINPSKSGVLFEKKFQKQDFSHFLGSIQEWGYIWAKDFTLI